jgi:alcohol dehydrogenase class IV
VTDDALPDDQRDRCFDHRTLGQRVLFGSGDAAHNIALAIDDLGARRVMVIAGARRRGTADSLLGDLPVAVRFSDVAPHVPLDVVTRATDAAVAGHADVVVAMGGGSTTGLAKAIALNTGLPIVAVPTTYAGSEATDVWGITDGGRKMTGADAAVLPRTVIYDAMLTVSLPVEMSTRSGMNAVAHCVDSLWAPRADPINRALAFEGLAALDSAIRGIVTAPADLAAREQALYGTYLAAVAFASAGSGLHHKICHVLGGLFDLPHAATHAVVLPHVVAFNEPGASELVRRVDAVLGAGSGSGGLAGLWRAARAPESLRELGMPHEGIRRAATMITDLIPPRNPRTVTAEDLERLLTAAWAGERP